MARTRPPAFQGIDFTQYHSWPVYVDPLDGKNYYEVPGVQGSFFDPQTGNVGSGATIVPSKKVEAEKKASEAINGKKPGMAEALIPTVVGTGATLGGIYGVNKLMNPSTAKETAGLVGNTAAATTDAAASSVAPAVVDAGTGLVNTGVSFGPGATLNTGLGEVGASVAPAGEAASAGLVGEAGSVAAPGAFDLAGIGGAGNAYLPAAGLVGAYDLFTNDRGPVAGTLEGAASGAAIGSYFGPVGIIPGGLIGGAVGLTKSLLNHETTRDVAKKHTEDLKKQAPDDSAYQQYVSGMRGQYDSAPSDPSKPFASKYSSWDEYKNAGLDAADLTGVYGNIKTFGPDWAHLSFDQQKQVTQGLINAGLYDSKKGEVVVTDEAKARQIKDEILSGKKIPPAPQKVEAPKPAQVAVPQQPVQVVSPQAPNTTTIPNQAFRPKPTQGVYTR